MGSFHFQFYTDISDLVCERNTLGVTVTQQKPQQEKQQNTASSSRCRYSATKLRQVLPNFAFVIVNGEF